MIKWWSELTFERKFNLVYGLVVLALVNVVWAAVVGSHWWLMIVIALLIGIWSGYG